MVWTPKPSFQAAWKVGHATIGSENAGWTTSKGGHPCNAGTAHNGFLQKRLEEDLCSIVPHVSPTTKSVIGLNWTELCGVKEDCRHLHLIWQWFNCSMLNLIDGLIYFMPDPLIDWFISCWIWSLSSSLLTYRGALNCCTLSLFYLSQLFCSVTLSSMNASCMQII